MLLGDEDPTICEHYVQAPNDVKVEFVNEPNPAYDTIVVSWKPSHFGMLTQTFSLMLRKHHENTLWRTDLKLSIHFIELFSNICKKKLLLFLPNPPKQTMLFSRCYCYSNYVFKSRNNHNCRHNKGFYQITQKKNAKLTVQSHMSLRGWNRSKDSLLMYTRFQLMSFSIVARSQLVLHSQSNTICLSKSEEVPVIGVFFIKF